MTPIHTSSWRITPSAPQADATAQLEKQGQLSVCFLSDTLARVTWRPESGFREPRTWAIAPLPAGASTQDVPWQGRERESLSGFERPTVTALAGTASLQTSRLRLTLQGDAKQPVRLNWHCAQTGQLLMQDRYTSAYLHERRTGLVRHCVQRDPSERYYGLGDKTGPLNLHGRRLRCLGQDSIGYDPKTGDPLYKHWPFLITRTAQGQWTGIYYDTLSACSFDLGCEHDNYHGLFRTTDIDDGDLDFYLMVGDTPAEVISQFVRLIGGTHLPPRWTLGYAQTAMGFADAPDAQQQLSQFIDQCVAHEIPISAFHYGSGYSSRGKQRYVFTWNRSKFPDPQAINAKFHAAGMRLIANLKPCLLDDHPAYAQLQSQNAFVSHTGNDQPVLEPFWDGMGSHLDFTREAAVTWWKTQLKAQIIDQGIEIGWNDNNEYALQAEDAYSQAWGQKLPIHRSRPLQPLLMTRATFEAQSHDRAAADNFTVTRAGPPGIQRYAQTWSGDNSSDWANLKWNIRTGLQMSLSGMFNIGHDVGGFFGPVPDAELFARWVQACCLNPRMVMNSWKEGGVSNVPWMHAEVIDIVKAAITLRYRLLPYLWQCFELASKQHTPIIRPTFFNFPNDPACLEDSDDFVLGDDLLVAPVVEAGARTRRVYLPALPQSGRWFAFDTKQAYASGQWIEVEAPLTHLPLFAREGAHIPVAQARAGQVPRFDDPVAETLRFA
jgi:alpha-glucosidase